MSVMAQLVEQEKNEYKRRLYQWAEQDNPDVADKPKLRGFPIPKPLEKFSSFFPSIRLSYKIGKNMTNHTEPPSVALRCVKNGGQPYGSGGLSDGEKFVLASLVDAWLLEGQRALFVNDEPERYLHAQLASDFWSYMERALSESIFVYATHSIKFAMRPSTCRLWVIGNEGTVAIQPDELSSLPAGQQRTFLGAIPSIATAHVGICVEGTDASFDSAFYQWILSEGDLRFAIRPYGGCEEVRAATRNTDLWKAVTPSTRVFGVIDRDYLADAELKAISTTHCIVLDLHEAESYLCDPQLVAALAKNLNRQGDISEEYVTDLIVAHLECNQLQDCAKRVFRRCSAQRRITLTNDRLRKIESEAEMIKVLKKLAEAEQKSAPVETSPDHVAMVFREEMKQYKLAIKERDVSKVLRLADGKELLKEVGRLFRTDGLGILHLVVGNLDAVDFDHTDKLRQKLSEFVGQSDDVSSESDPTNLIV